MRFETALKNAAQALFASLALGAAVPPSAHAAAPLRDDVSTVQMDRSREHDAQLKRFYEKMASIPSSDPLARSLTRLSEKERGHLRWFIDRYAKQQRSQKSFVEALADHERLHSDVTTYKAIHELDLEKPGIVAEVLKEISGRAQKWLEQEEGRARTLDSRSSRP